MNLLHIVQGVNTLIITMMYTLTTRSNSSLAIQIYLRNVTFYVDLGPFIIYKMHYATVQAREGSGFRPDRCLSIQSRGGGSTQMNVISDLFKPNEEESRRFPSLSNTYILIQIGIEGMSPSSLKVRVGSSPISATQKRI